MSKGSDTTTQRQVAEPWSGVQDYLKEGFSEAKSLYDKGAPAFYPNQTVAPLSGYTLGALDWQAERAQAGSPVMQSAQSELQKTLGGDYLQQGNPYLQNAIDKATRPVVDRYQEVVMPGLDSTFSSAGRYGSGAHQAAANRGYSDMMTQLGDISGQMAYQNYGDERTNQLRAQLFAPEMAQADYFDINQLGAAGSALDAYNQQLINADVEKYNYEQNAPQKWLSDYMGTLGMAPWGSTTTSQQPAPNIFTSALGGGIAGGSIGGWPGALVGGGLGLLSGLF